MDTINRALSVKGGSARLLYVYVDVEPVSFNRGFYTVDMRFFYHVTLQAYLSCPVPVTVEGLCVFDKRAILFGSEGNAKIFSSQMAAGSPDPQMMQRANAPIAVKYAKACIDRGMQMDIDDGIAVENELFAMCFATEDQKEGMGAFLEKRKEKHFQNK